MTKRLYLISALLLSPLLLTATGAWAATAANTQIVNTATLTYNNGRTASATAIVTVALAPSTPNVRITAATAAYSGPNSPSISDTLIITATANGPAAYTITPAIPGGGSTNVSAANPASVNINNNPNSLMTIGASITTGSSGQTFVTVPAGGSSGNNSPVNEIDVGSTIVFTVNGNSYSRTVTGTVHDAVTSTYRIYWSDVIPVADIPPAGVLVAEQKVISVTVLPGTVQTVGIPITVTVAVKVSTSGAAEATATTATPNSWTTTTTNSSLAKYVRNVTAASGNGAPYLYNSAAYYGSGVTAKPGDLLEYLLVSTNSGANAVTLAAVTDQLSIDFTSLRTGAYGGGRDVTYVSDTNAVSYYTIAVDSDQATFNAATGGLTVYLGSGATSSGGGSIPGNKSVLVLYQVTVNH